MQNSRYKAMGFEVLTEDDRVFYPLAADNETELEQWVETLNRAITISQGGETDDRLTADISSFYAKETIKDAKKIDISPDLLEVSGRPAGQTVCNHDSMTVYTQHNSGTTDAKNTHNRQKDSHPLFQVYPELMVQAS